MLKTGKDRLEYSACSQYRTVLNTNIAVSLKSIKCSNKYKLMYFHVTSQISSGTTIAVDCNLRKRVL